LLALVLWPTAVPRGAAAPAAATPEPEVVKKGKEEKDEKK
jgi:hypothetical protein